MSPAGGLFAGRFRVGRLLGTGGTSAVYAAVDTSSGEMVALKVLHSHLAESRTRRAAFLREAHRSAAVRHRNVVRVVDSGEVTTRSTPMAWIASELVTGRSLAERVADEGPFTPDEAVVLIGGVLDGLQAIHAAGLVHRDLTPSNVLLDETVPELTADTPRLTDLGLADRSGLTVRELDAEVPSVIGSADFMSPEQLRGESVDARSDIYQLGAVLYFCVTGQPPFRRASVAEVLEAQLSMPPPPPSVLDPRIPRVLDRIVVRAMLKPREGRFDSAGAMAAALDRVMPPREQQLAHEPAGQTLVLPRGTAAAGTPPDYLDSEPIESPELPDPPRRRVDLVGIAAALAILSVAGVGITWALVGGDQDVAAPAATQPPAAVTSAATPRGEAPPVTVQLPDLATMTGQTALAALETAGLLPGEVTTRDTSAPSGTVLATEPAAGSTVVIGSVVDLVVASGRNSVPEVAGLAEEQAIEAIRSAGFSVSRRLVTTGTATGAQGTDPASGVTVPVGSLVTVLLPRATPTPTPTPTDTDEPEVGG